MHERLRKFLFPDLNRAFLIRLGAVAVGAYVLCGHICIPTRIHGRSMEPTYRDGGVNFCWRLRYLFAEPAVGDIVVVRMSGTRVMLLKRVVAVAGDVLEFRQGQLHVNGKQVTEDYVQGPCDWQLEPRTVKSGHVYVVGDNRAVPMASHRFGQTAVDRIVGGTVW